MVYIYVLQLEKNKYYIGKTNNPHFRIKNHFNSNGSFWTKKYKPLKILELIPNCDNFDEDKYTKIYMSKYGIDNVRGGSFCQIKIPKYQFDSLKKELITVSDRCYKCGKIGHFSNKCTKYKKSLDDELKDIKKKFIKMCKNIDLNKNKKISLDNILSILKKSSDMFLDTRITNIRGLCQKNNACISLNYIDYSKGIINYIDFINGLIYILLNNPKTCNVCNQEGHTANNCMVYGTKKQYKKKYYSSESEDNIESEDDIEIECWECKYCSKLFNTLKGAKIHENNYCKKKIIKKNNNNSCYRCGRTGHYSSNCYAKKHIKGYYL